MSGLDELSREELIAPARGLTIENAELRERVARLERLVSRNSGNSGMPPSTDDLPGRPRPKDKPVRGGKRRPGKRPGSPGTALAWADDVNPADTFEHFPAGVCACGADLAMAADLGVTARHQQVEIPLVVAKRLQHNLHTVTCGCGKVYTAARSEGVPAALVSLGVNLQSWCVYLMVAHAIPVHRVAEPVTSLTGAEPSPGFVHGLLKRAAAAVEQVNRSSPRRPA